MPRPSLPLHPAAFLALHLLCVLLAFGVLFLCDLALCAVCPRHRSLCTNLLGGANPVQRAVEGLLLELACPGRANDACFRLFRVTYILLQRQDWLSSTLNLLEVKGT